MASPTMATKPQSSDRKYQLFPKGAPTSTVASKPLDPEQAFALAMKGDVAGTGGSVRIRKDTNLSARRRKISVPELGPMTTVQEAAMDSPTIPGLRPVHERSASAPGGPSGRNHIVDFARPLPPITKEQKDLLAEFAAAAALDQPESPVKSGALSPLIIPKSSNRTNNNVSSRFRSGSSPNENANYTTNRREDSPVARGQDKDREVRYLPQIWDRAGTPPAGSPPPPPVKTAEVEPTTRIMDRGRPRKRGHSRNVSNMGSSSSSSTDSPKRSLSSERRAFENLPRGHTLANVASALSSSELHNLRTQALEQSTRFEIMRSKNVDTLSKELRALDERVEYLRNTYTSLRAGRRNLHGRVLTLLKSGTRFSTDALLKQEEALAELDTSIDEWLSKLDVAENRRTRVRQKLLEHVAAAAMIPVMQPSPTKTQATTGHGSLSTPPRSPTKAPSGPALRETERDINRSVSTPMRPILPATIFEAPGKKLLPRKTISPVATQQLPKQSVISLTGSLVSPMGSRGGHMESIMIFAASDVYGPNGTGVSPNKTLSSVPSKATAFKTIKRSASQRVNPTQSQVAFKKDKPTTAAHRVREREMTRSRSFETLPSTKFSEETLPATKFGEETLPTTTFKTLPTTTFDSPIKSSAPRASAVVKPLTIKKSVTQPIPTTTPLSPRDDGVNSDTEVVYLTSAVFSG